MKREYILTLLSDREPLASRLHAISKNPQIFDSFWTMVEMLCDDYRERLDRAATSQQRTEIVQDVIYEAFDRLPDIRHQSMVKYLWQMVDDQTRIMFKVMCKNPKSDAGQANMAQLVAYLEERDHIDYQKERDGYSAITPALVLSVMPEWMLSR